MKIIKMYIMIGKDNFLTLCKSVSYIAEVYILHETNKFSLPLLGTNRFFSLFQSQIDIPKC